MVPISVHLIRAGTSPNSCDRSPNPPIKAGSTVIIPSFPLSINQSIAPISRRSSVCCSLPLRCCPPHRVLHFRPHLRLCVAFCTFRRPHLRSRHHRPLRVRPTRSATGAVAFCHRRRTLPWGCVPWSACTAVSACPCRARQGPAPPIRRKGGLIMDMV